MTGEPQRPDRPKAPPTGLDLRAPRPRPVRLRPGAVRLVVGGGAVLVAGALTWAFVVQPELRQQARLREIDARDAPGAGAVRPAEAVVGQPASYDRLPPPRMVSPGGEDVPPAQAAVSTASPAADYDRLDRPAPPSGPSTAELAARAGIFFAPPAGAAAYLAGLGAGPDALLLKRVRAGAGDRVCSEGGLVWTPTGTLAVGQRDRRGAALPQWRGCRVLEGDEVFVTGDTPTSFDSRYFGPVRTDRLRGVYREVVSW